MAILRDAFARAYDQATVDPQTTSATCHRHHCTVKSCCSHKVAMGELWLVVFLVLIRPCYIWLLSNCSGNKIVGQKMKREPYCSTCWLDIFSFLGIQHLMTCFERAGGYLWNLQDCLRHMEWQCGDTWGAVMKGLVQMSNTTPCL